jgi:hypothetical protein
MAFDVRLPAYRANGMETSGSRLAERSFHRCAGRAKLAHDRLGVAIQIASVPDLSRFLLGLQIGAQGPATSNQPSAVTKSVALVAVKRPADIGAGRVQDIGKRSSIESGLGHTGADMWPRNKSSIAEEHRAAEHKLRTFQIEDRLQERLSERPHQSTHLWCKDFSAFLKFLDQAAPD